MVLRVSIFSVGILAGVLAVILTLGTATRAEAENFRPAIWVDPDGCEHWVMDDGAEGYMTPNVRRDGTPVCRGDDVCGVLYADLLFETNSTRASASGRKRLKQFFDGANAQSYIVTGHTDSRGSDEFNMNLSRGRANAVAGMARQFGARITNVVGYGERRPKATNRTGVGRGENRRVEILCLH